MHGKWRRWGIGLLGWLIGPALVWGALTGLAGLIWALLAGLPPVVVGLIALGALTLGLAIAHLALSFAERLRGQRKRDQPDLCDKRLSELRQSARQFAHHLENIRHSWPAIKDPEAEKHEDARHTILHSFGQFFSVAWTYQSFCRGHRHRDEVIEWVDGVYDALGELLPEHKDLRLDAEKLHKIGERSTLGWAQTQARPLTLAEFEDELEVDDSPLVRRLKPLEKFLIVAGPETEGRACLLAAAVKVRHVEKKLKKLGYSR